MAEVVTRSTQPAVAAIKLAWWRERLAELDHGKMPAEPRLQAASSELLTRGISGAELGELEQSWACILRADDQATFMRGVASRGPILFKLAARLLRIEMTDLVEDAAQSFLAADLARRNVTSLAPQKLRRSKSRAPRRARALTALGCLARRDMRRGGPPFEAEATPLRALALIRHRLTGRY